MGTIKRCQWFLLWQWLFLRRAEFSEVTRLQSGVALGKPHAFLWTPTFLWRPVRNMPGIQTSASLFSLTEWLPHFTAVPWTRACAWVWRGAWRAGDNHKIKYLTLAGSNPTRCGYTSILHSLATTLDFAPPRNWSDTPAGECHLAPSQGRATAHQGRRTEPWNQPVSTTD